MYRRITGVFLILIPVLFNVAFFALGSAFEYPDILREPTDYILTEFTAGGQSLINLWYAFAMTALLAIPLALLLYGLFREEYPQIAFAAAVVGVLSGLVQVMGLLRWVFLVPLVAEQYTQTADPSVQASAALIFETAHHYLGVAVGEHLGYFFTGSWTILLAVMMLRSRLFRSWMGIVGMIAAAGIMVGLLEPAGWEPAGAINAISYIVWSLWLMVAGVFVLLSTRTTA
ncbi:MAG: hypothetical protein OHK0046_08160 [Anaerolineae bacterium]